MDDYENAQATNLGAEGLTSGTAHPDNSTAATLDEHRKLLFRWCDSYSRLPALLDLASILGTSDWLQLLGENWSCCDNIGVYSKKILRLLKDEPKPIREMMTKWELVAFHKLPDVFHIYRGCYQNNKHGLSWSLSEKTAERFPSLNRYRQKGIPILVTAEVKKADVVALKLDRKEREIITWRPKIISVCNIAIDEKE